MKKTPALLLKLATAIMVLVSAPLSADAVARISGRGTYQNDLGTDDYTFYIILGFFGFLIVITIASIVFKSLLKPRGPLFSIIFGLIYVIFFTVFMLIIFSVSNSPQNSQFSIQSILSKPKILFSSLQNLGSGGGIVLLVGAFIILMFIIVGIVFYKTHRDHAWLMKNGLPGQAKILSVTDTGVKLNGVPLLTIQAEIHTAGKAPYTVNKRLPVPMIAMSTIVSGSMVPVRIHPHKPKKITFANWNYGNNIININNNIGSNDFNAGTSGLCVGNVDQGDFQNGIPAQAKILNITKTDQIKNGQSVYRINYDIQPNNKHAYKLEREVPLPDMAANLLHIGSTYPCEVHPDDPRRIKLKII
ncbi:MAG: hypothetical protein A2233_02780 [Candidatus Kerfeldbacteria bacterium RIFOXYA2_FULL_38_24]|uniref:Uncharacterized protein n=1 Tax=Candidatus Kerfeldbacteria bacterium RIFOXYB2_FULL_38_14 TaxID=1798547 RepID=A0A1G2BFX0_9BACT|nr:MAG: hypothetical protein A2233_02780 [Candidatus Kerfeldbacteria bacterium RIFOXYA2_FULL_38_24]OGY87107.1 MAG: hypothetical protein A2319_02790 [Candidatus Kerfeldbacteria bacterium RIFOXYB2_FULL_38_14]